MATFEFNMEGMEELERDLREAIEEYPEDMRKGLRTIAKDFKESVKDKTPDGKNHRGDASTKMRKKFGIRTRKEGETSIALIYNSSPHFHLVEKGHNVVRGGRVVGFVPGKHMMEKTRNEFQDIIPDRFETLCNQVLRRHDL
ncbi:MAG: hypothetical protein HFH41_04070 [Lachnospiraceae bacterium]|nr:hypothetical protein [Lachnospiraceae bacterium]